MTRIILHGERPKSWNAYWAGAHWTKRKKERDRVHIAVRIAMDVESAEIYKQEVDITITAYFDTTGRKKILDSGNIASKPYVDALIGWYIEDDSRKYVRSVTTRSEIDNEYPRLVIDILPTEEPIGEYDKGM